MVSCIIKDSTRGGGTKAKLYSFLKGAMPMDLLTVISIIVTIISIVVTIRDKKK